VGGGFVNSQGRGFVCLPTGPASPPVLTAPSQVPVRQSLEQRSGHRRVLLAFLLPKLSRSHTRTSLVLALRGIATRCCGPLLRPCVSLSWLFVLCVRFFSSASHPSQASFERVEMGKNSGDYAQKPTNEDKAVKSRGFNLHVHFKKTLETANALRHRKLKVCRRTSCVCCCCSSCSLVSFVRNASNLRCVPGCPALPHQRAGDEGGCAFPQPQGRSGSPCSGQALWHLTVWLAPQGNTSSSCPARLS
jgi:hypothetical protein